MPPHRRLHREPNRLSRPCRLFDSSQNWTGPAWATSRSFPCPTPADPDPVDKPTLPMIEPCPASWTIRLPAILAFATGPGSATHGSPQHHDSPIQSALTLHSSPVAAPTPPHRQAPALLAHPRPMDMPRQRRSARTRTTSPLVAELVLTSPPTSLARASLLNPPRQPTHRVKPQLRFSNRLAFSTPALPSRPASARHSSSELPERPFITTPRPPLSPSTLPPGSDQAP